MAFRRTHRTSGLPVSPGIQSRASNRHEQSPMEAERLNQIAATIADLRARADEARRYL